eukprot:309277_1
MMQKVLLCTLVASWMAMGALSAMVNSEIKRNIDLSKSIVRIQSAITVEGHKGQSTYEVVVREELVENLAWLSVTNALSPDTTRLPYERLKHDKHGYAVYAVRLGDEERSSETLKLNVLLVFTEVLKPLPSTIEQADPHMVLFEVTSLVPSPYETTKQETTLHLVKDSKVVSYSAQKPTKQTQSKKVGFFGGIKITCGPYEGGSTPAWNAGEKLSVHYVTPAMFAKATDVVREIEVSHWGNIAVEESYEVVHNGAKLEGEWARLQFFKQTYMSDTPDSSFTELKAMLPPGAHDLYYRDKIGNVSTSTVTKKRKGVDFTVKPRYPMYGGWSTSWYMGYNLRSEEVLRSKVEAVGGTKMTYSFTLPFALPFDELWAEAMTVKVILPEFATNIKATVPFKVEESHSKRFTYLDSPRSIGGGREVVFLRMRNVVNEHNVPLTVSYDYEPLFVYWKALLLALVFMSLLLIHMVFSLCFRGQGSIGRKLAKVKSQ